MSAWDRVVLRFRGLMLEKFLERALREGAHIEAARRIDRREARIETDARGERLLLALAKRYALDLSPVARRGVPVLWQRVRRRWPFLASLLVSAFFFGFLLTRVWVIEIVPVGAGADAAQVAAALGRLGVCVGMPAKRLDEHALRAALLSRLPDFAFLSAHRTGVCLTIQAAAALAPPDLYDPAESRDLVADRDALVLTVDVLAGTPAVKPGDLVRRGQILIRGAERDTRDGALRGVCALGRVLGRVFSSGSAQAGLVALRDAPTGRTRNAVSLATPFGAYPLTQAEPYPRGASETQLLPVVGTLIPVSLSRTRYIEYETRRETRKEADVRREIGRAALEAALDAAPQGQEPIDKWTDYSIIEDGRICARTVLQYHMNIAVAR